MVRTFLFVLFFFQNDSSLANNCNTEQGGIKSKSYGLGTGWLSPQHTSRRRWRRFPLWYCTARLPDRGTRLPLSPHCNPPDAPQMDSLGDFHSSHAVSYPLLQTGFQGNRTASLAREGSASTPLFTVPTQGRLLCTQRSGGTKPLTHRDAGL